MWWLIIEFKTKIVTLVSIYLFLLFMKTPCRNLSRPYNTATYKHIFSFVNIRLENILEELPLFLEIDIFRKPNRFSLSLCLPVRSRISLKDKTDRKILETFLLLFESYLIRICSWWIIFFHAHLNAFYCRYTWHSLDIYSREFHKGTLSETELYFWWMETAFYLPHFTDIKMNI